MICTKGGTLSLSAHSGRNQPKDSRGSGRLVPDQRPLFAATSHDLHTSFFAAEGSGSNRKGSNSIPSSRSEFVAEASER
jgi:hypothetical protein